MIRLRLRLRRDRVRGRLRLRRDRVRGRLRRRRDRLRLRSSVGEARGARSRVRDGLRLLLATAAAVVLIGSSSVFACSVCFGAEETSMIDGTKLGILVLLGITISVQGAFVGFFLYLRQRAKRIAEADLDTEWSQLQGTSRAS